MLPRRPCCCDQPTYSPRDAYAWQAVEVHPLLRDVTVRIPDQMDPKPIRGESYNRPGTVSISNIPVSKCRWMKRIRPHRGARIPNSARQIRPTTGQRPGESTTMSPKTGHIVGRVESKKKQARERQRKRSIGKRIVLPVSRKLVERKHELILTAVSSGPFVVRSVEM